MAPGPKEASKPSGKVVSLILVNWHSALHVAMLHVMLRLVSISHHGRCVLGSFGICLCFGLLRMLIDAQSSHFARLVISIQPVLNKIHKSRCSGT